MPIGGPDVVGTLDLRDVVQVADGAGVNSNQARKFPVCVDAGS
jgi:hypothetical protein